MERHHAEYSEVKTMKFYNIVKDGIFNVIDEGQYEAIYKPCGGAVQRYGARHRAFGNGRR